jgi:hypothetical protein
VNRLLVYSAAILGLWGTAALLMFGGGTAAMWNESSSTLSSHPSVGKRGFWWYS